MSTIVIAGYKRSPFHFANKGALVKVRPDDLAASVVRALVAETGIETQDLEDLIVGCAFPEGEQGFNVGRLIGLLAKLPLGVAGTTVNRFCGSSMQAIHMAAGAIALGAGDAFIAGGVESMTRVPMGGFNPMPNPKLMDPAIQAFISMGDTAENLAAKYGISRREQDEFSLASHQKAAKAWMAGHYAGEIVPIETPDGVVDKDGCIRPDTTIEKLGELKLAFKQDGGSVTAGNSSPLTDGASATLITSEDYAKSHVLKIMARIKSIAVAGCAPDIMGIGPVPAAHKAMKRAGVTMNDIDIVELNEAFAAQSLAVIRDLNIPMEKLNLDGGAIALGHPLGASGARVVGHAAALLQREKKNLALATMCIGGGMGIATVLGGCIMARYEVLEASDLERELQSLPDWKLNGDKIVAHFKFPDFRYALLFINLIGMECDKLDHHPDLSNTYNVVGLAFNTHDAGNKITQMDLKLARFASQAAHDLKGSSHDH